MKGVLALIALATSVYGQFRAFPLYLPRRLHRAHYDPCNPLTIQCVRMHGGHYGTRSYENLQIPHYTAYLREVEHAVDWVKTQTTTLKDPAKSFNDKLHGSIPHDYVTQYQTILVAIMDLVEQFAQHGANMYTQFYQPTVLKTLTEVSNNPVQATGKVWALLDHFLDHIAQIKSLIKHKEEKECVELKSKECDMIIQFLLDQSSDQVLKLQADLLVAGGKEVEIFMVMNSIFSAVAYYDQVEDFLINGVDILKPLVQAGFETFKKLKAIESLSLPLTHSRYTHKKIFFLKEVLDKIANLGNYGLSSGSEEQEDGYDQGKLDSDSSEESEEENEAPGNRIPAQKAENANSDAQQDVNAAHSVQSHDNHEQTDQDPHQVNLIHEHESDQSEEQGDLNYFHIIHLNEDHDEEDREEEDQEDEDQEDKDEEDKDQEDKDQEDKDQEDEDQEANKSGQASESNEEYEESPADESENEAQQTDKLENDKDLADAAPHQGSPKHYKPKIIINFNK